jgi:outer membrane protein insertion porin family
MASKLVRRAAIVLVAIGALALLLIAVAHLPSVRARVLDRVRTFAARDLGLVIDAAALDYRIPGRSAELRNVSVAAARGEPPLVRADAVRVVFTPRLFRGIVEVQRLEIVGARLALVRHADGSMNLPVSKGPRAAPSPVHLGLVTIRQLTVSLDDEMTGRGATLGPLDLEMDTSGVSRDPGRFGPSAFSIQTTTGPEGTTLSGTIAGRLGFDGRRITVAAMRADTPDGRLSLDGWLDAIAESPRLEVRSTIDVDLARAARTAGLTGPPLTGGVRATLTAAGPLLDPTVHARVEGDDLSAGPMKGLRLRSETTIAHGLASIRQLDLASDAGRIGASGDLALSGTRAADTKLRGNWQQLDLDRVLASAGARLPLRLGTRAQGRIEIAGGADPLISGSALPAGLAVEADVQLTPTASHGLDGRAHLRLRDEAWTLGHDLVAPAARTSLSGTLSGRLLSSGSTRSSSLAGTTDVRIEDVGYLLETVRAAGIELPPQAAGSGLVTARVAVGGTLQRPTASATIAGRGLRTADLPAGDVDATLAADHRRVQITALEARAPGLALHASGAYAFRGDIDARFDATTSDVGQVARAFGPADIDVSGSAKVEGTARGSVSVPRVDATLTARDLVVHGTAIGRLDTTLALAGDRLDVKASTPDLGVRADGHARLAAAFPFDAVARLENLPLARLVPPGSMSPAPEGGVSGEVSARGLLRRPLESSVDGAIHALDVRLSGTSVSLEAPATISLSSERVATTPLALRIGESTRARLAGAIGLRPTSEPLTLVVDGPLSDLVAAGAQLTTEPVSAEGTLALDVRVTGTLDNPVPSGTLTSRASSIRIGELPPVTGVVLDARLEPTRVVLQSLAAVWQCATVTADGAFPWRLVVPTSPSEAGASAPKWGATWLTAQRAASPTATLNARVTGVTPAVLAPFVAPSRLQDVEGTVAASLKAETDTLSLEGVRAIATLDQAALKLAGIPFGQATLTRVRLDKGVAMIEDLRWDAQGNEIRASGRVDLNAPDPIADLGLNGTLDLRVLGAFADGIAAAGTARTDLKIAGPLTQPVVVGLVAVSDGELRLDTPAIVASDFSGDVRLGERNAATVNLAGSLNGGTAKITGALDLTWPAEPRGKLSLDARNVALEYPDGFFTESNADLTMTLGGTRASLAGRVSVLDGTYREPLMLTGGLFGAAPRDALAPSTSQSPFLSTLALDIKVDARQAVRVDNNYGRLELTANLQVAGTAERPGAIGRVEAAPDGEIYVGGNVYRVQRLVVDLTSPNAIVPAVSFLAETRVGDVPIAIELECDATGPCERHVRSLASGVSDEVAEERLMGLSNDAGATGTQLARLLSGEVFGVVGRKVGLDTLRLDEAASGTSDIFDDPTLVAGDVDPASRLTLGKRIGDNVEVAYSRNLADKGFTWSTTYNAPFGTSFRLLLLDDQSRSYEFRHEPNLGSSPRTRPDRPRRPKIEAVRFGGTPGVTEEELRSHVKLTEGDRFDFAAWQEDRDRLTEWYRSQGFLEARVTARRQNGATTGAPAPEPERDTADPGDPAPVVLDYTIERGQRTNLVVRGTELPDPVRDRVLARWSTAVFDGFLERDARAIVREHLYREGYLQARVDAYVTAGDSTGLKTLAITVEPGEFTPRRLEFTGHELIPAGRLYAAAEETGGLAAWLNPSSLEQAVLRVYHGQGLLAASVNVPDPVVRDGVSIATVVIREGPPFHVGRSAIDGLPAAIQSNPDALGLTAGSRYQPQLVRDGIAALEERLRQSGFLDARVEASTSVDAARRLVNVAVCVEAGARSLLSDVVVEGADPDSRSITRAIALEPGAPVDPAALVKTRRQLYDIGTFRSVDIALEPRDGTATAAATDGGDQSVVARVRLEKRPQYRLRYGLAYNDDVVGVDERERHVGFAADFENRDLFGTGATTGISARLRGDQQIGRLFLGANRFFGLPLRSTLFLQRSHETDSGGFAPIVSDETEISAEQAYRVRRDVEVRYGYGLGQNRTVIEGQDFDIRVRIARVTSSGLVDRRRNPFDPEGGWFTSATLELSRPGIGSDLSFLKSLLQYFRFDAVGRGIIIGSAARVGLARTFEEQDLIPSERFFAGGATTVRGFREDDLGPRGIFGDAEGGSALLIFNEEFRFPIYRWLRGVGFLDAGNVYPRVGDISFSELLVGAGAGLRLDTPLGIVRFDLGIPVNRRDVDPKWRIHFGLGHTF